MLFAIANTVDYFSLSENHTAFRWLPISFCYFPDYHVASYKQQFEYIFIKFTEIDRVIRCTINISNSTPASVNVLIWLCVYLVLSFIIWQNFWKKKKNNHGIKWRCFLRNWTLEMATVVAIQLATNNLTMRIRTIKG